MARSQVVVLTYVGSEPNEPMLLDLNSAVMDAGGYGVTVHVMDIDDVATACARLVMSKTVKAEVKENPLEQAVVYIGEKFADSLTVNKNIAKFSAEIARNAAMAHFAGGDMKLLKAIEILSTHSGTIPKSVATKYGINRAALSAIRAAYQVSLK